MENVIDIDENIWSKKIIEILLFDRTTNRNIIWATDNYEYLGELYNAKYPIEYDLITGENSGVIKPRVKKDNDRKINRTKQNAEVFTPSWICNEQCNLVDDAWFERKGVFNKSDIATKTWKTTTNRIEFPKNNKEKTWEKYVDENRLEITCGEAPYLVSRYDIVTGDLIPIKDRIGFLDRKLRIVAENVYANLNMVHR